MSRTAVVTEKAPKAIPGIYSQAIVANGFVYCSGCVPMDASTMKLIEGDIQAHTVGLPTPFRHPKFKTNATQHQCIKNLGAILDAAGSSLEDVVEVNVFLADMNDFAKMNEIYTEYWGETKPART